MSDTEPTSCADVRFLVFDPLRDAIYCRRSFTEAAAVATSIGCSLVTQSRYGDGRLLAPEGVIARYRRQGETWHVETSPRVV